MTQIILKILEVETHFSLSILGSILASRMGLFFFCEKIFLGKVIGFACCVGILADRLNVKGKYSHCFEQAFFSITSFLHHYLLDVFYPVLN